MKKKDSESVNNIRHVTFFPDFVPENTFLTEKNINYMTVCFAICYKRVISSNCHQGKKGFSLYFAILLFLRLTSQSPLVR